MHIFDLFLFHSNFYLSLHLRVSAYITSTTCSMMIGQAYGLGYYTGYMDEVRVQHWMEYNVKLYVISIEV